MADRVLGLDLGPTSIGWALLDESQREIIACGVRVFPEGVDRDQKGAEKSKSQTRRTARGMRRQIRRRAMRKQRLCNELRNAGLLPTDPVEFAALMDHDPYELRAKGLSTKLTPHEFGRLLLHLNQRRGFKSNRRVASADSDAKGMLKKIGDLNRELDGRTLGQFLAEKHKAFDHSTSSDEDRVRHRHTRRDMLYDEFDKVWSAQQAHHNGLLTDELRQKLFNTIFFQREMYWPKSIIGRCELEPREKRCPKAHRVAQRIRILQEVNNLRCLDRSTGEERRLTDDERRILIDDLADSASRSFDQIRKKLKLSPDVLFNFERGGRKGLKGNETDAELSKAKALGKRAWRALPEETKSRIVEVLIDVEDDAAARTALCEDCGLTEAQANAALSLHLPDGRANLSLKAMLNLLPHLERGLSMMGNDKSDSALHAAGYLRPDQRTVNPREFLPPPPDLPNPIVRQALVEARKVINAIIREYGRPDRIHVELAREAKKSFEERRRMRFEKKEREERRARARAEINSIDPTVNPGARAVERYLLWREQSEKCPYCLQMISQAQLFSDEVDRDHILPRWRSLDDSFGNKVLCHRKCNHLKGDRTPREWLEHEDPERYLRVVQFSRNLPYGKQRKFLQRDIQLDDFVQRQMNDTAYISRCVVQYLQCLNAVVLTPRGQMTAELRHWWGLNNILDPEGRGRKMRNDHRHHAIDAIIIALTNRERLFAVANARGENMPAPWTHFFEDVKHAVERIIVSHRARRRLSGALHDDLFYGATHKPQRNQSAARPWAAGWVEAPEVFVRRRAVTEIKRAKDLCKVRDESIRNILRQHLLNRGISPDAGSYPKDAFAGKNAPRMPSGVPIKRVRMLESSKTIRQVSEHRDYQFAMPNSNHHVVYRSDGKGGKWTTEVVTMWDAAKRGRRQGLPLVDRSNSQSGVFLFSLSIGEMFEIDGDDGARMLCVVYKMRQDGRISYVLHHDAREKKIVNKDNQTLSAAKMRSLNAKKVSVDALGRIRHAND